MTDAPPDPVALALLRIIEDLCAAIVASTGLGWFARLLLIPVRRQLRGMAELVSAVIADPAADGPEPFPIFIAGNPAWAQDGNPQTPPRAATEPTRRDPCWPPTQADRVDVAPLRAPGPAAETLVQDQCVPLLAATRAAPSRDDSPAGARPAPVAAAAPAVADAGRRVTARGRTTPARNVTAPAIAALCRAASGKYRRVPDRKVVFAGRVLHAYFVAV